MINIPPRYEPVRRLGSGGGGEVWAVRDRVNERVLALKVLAEDAGESEVMALVREAISLSGLEGLGVPHVVAFGALPESGRRYMVRELVEGQSLEDVMDTERGVDWLEPLAQAAEQLTVLHRAGLLHGDIKPANVIVGEHGKGTLVDLGLAAPWREGGTLARGLTPKYAAPELLTGEALTVRAEVYAMGATLADGLGRRGSELTDDVRFALAKIAARATEHQQTARYPSVDELASALRRAAGLAASPIADEPAWPVLGLDATAARLAAAVAELAPGTALAIEGPAGSGRTTLARRLAWTLGVEGQAVAAVEAPRGRMTAREAVDIELVAWQDKQASLILVVDDLHALDAASREAIAGAAKRGGRVVAVGSAREAATLVKGHVTVFEVPPLDPHSAEELVRRAVPSLPDGLRAHLVDRLEGRPGRLREFLKRLGRRAVVSEEDVDAILAGPISSGSVPPAPKSRDELFCWIERALDMGRIAEGSEAILELGAAKNEGEKVRIAILRGRAALGRGDAAEAARVLDGVGAAAAKSAHRRAWGVARARAALRCGDYAGAAAFADKAGASTHEDAIAADALAVQGVALAYTGEDERAQKILERAVAIAKKTGDRRIEGVALGSMAFAHQRASRIVEARAAYEGSLAAAEAARDAGTVAAMRLNLSGLAQNDGNFALALTHLEAAIDMGRRAGGLVAVQQALLNLASLDLYLGRYSRASVSIDSLVQQRDALGAHARTQLLGLEGELALRTGDIERGAKLYEECATAWDTQGRPLDAAETRLEGLLARTRGGKADCVGLARELEAVRAKLGDGGFREHEALAGIVRGSIALLAGDENAARLALDDALDQAQKAGRREWAWRALDARARLAASQGAVAMARRDTDAALAMLEETAAKLPRDLREVFWDDPRRRALRQAHTATAIAPLSLAPSSAITTAPSPSGGGQRDGSSAASRQRGLPQSASGNTTNFGAPFPAEDRLARIFEITRELAREHDIGRLLTKVTDHAIALLGAERGFVVLANDMGELEAHAARDRRGGDEPHARFSRSVAEKVVRMGEPVIAISARDDERLAEAVSVHQLMIQSIACVPIRGAPPVGRTIGALYVETRLRPGLRFNDELPTLMAFADQAAIAIENARLLAENAARAEDLARANIELATARDKLADALGRRTEQLSIARRDLKQVRAELRSHFGYAGLVGTSAPMRKLYAIIERIKDTDVPVLITGESGTGKEIVAKAVHASGPRARSAFLGVNCGAIPGNLLESELFGHVRGAFTGADRDRKGLFQEAEHGTLLLDEIGEMPSKMQTGLLRALQEKTVRPVGGVKEEPIDVRVIAATNRNLEQMVKDGTFREDLFYRLHVVELRVPPLRERSDDIAPLIDHFLTLFAARYRRERKTVGREALRRLVAYEWPGNVRQLEHVLLNAWLMGDTAEIVPDDLPLPDGARNLPSGDGSMARSAADPGLVAQNKEEFKDTERERILNALTSSNWNRVQAAKVLGIPRRTFYRRLKEYGIL